MERWIEKTRYAYRQLVRVSFIVGIAIFAREAIVQIHDSYVVAEDFGCLAKHREETISQSALIAQASVGGGVGGLLKENPCNVRFWVGDFSVSERAWYSGRPDYNRIPFFLWGLAGFLPALALLMFGRLSERMLLPLVRRVGENRLRFGSHAIWPGAHED